MDSCTSSCGGRAAALSRNATASAAVWTESPPCSTISSSAPAALSTVVPMDSRDRPWTVLTIFGTRPEVIKLAPVLRELATTSGVRSVTVSSGQHADLLTPFLALFDLRTDHD